MSAHEVFVEFQAATYRADDMEWDLDNLRTLTCSLSQVTLWSNSAVDGGWKLAEVQGLSHRIDEATWEELRRLMVGKEGETGADHLD